MPRTMGAKKVKFKIDEHPKKDKIIKDIIAGKGIRAIETKYGVPRSSVEYYLKQRLYPQAVEAQVARGLKNGEFVLSEVDAIMIKMKKLYDACDEYLTDPADSTKYSLLPRAWEQEIRYLDYSMTTDKDQKPMQKTMQLQQLIDMMHDRQMEIVHIKNTFQDPRKVITETANVLTKQLELMARIQGTIKDVSISIINNPAWVQVQAIILNVAEKFPDIREDLAREFAKLGGK